MNLSTSTASEVRPISNRTGLLQPGANWLRNRQSRNALYRNRCHRLLVWLGSCLLLASFICPPVHGQTVTATVSVGINPDALAVNPRTNKIYVSDFVCNNPCGGITVIDGKTNTTKTLTTVAGQVAVAVNPFSNLIYFVDGFNNLTVVDGSTDTVKQTIKVGQDPVAVAVNPTTNKVYVVNQTDNTVSILDVNNNYSATVVSTVGGPNLLQGFTPLSVFVNPVTGKVYVTCQTANLLIDPSNNQVTQLSYTGGLVNGGPIGLDPVTNTIFAVDGGSSQVLVINESTNALETTVSSNLVAPLNIAMNPVTNTAYVLNTLIDDVTAIDGTTFATTLVKDAKANGPVAVTVNPSTDQIFVANSTSNNVTVINGSTYATTVDVGTNPVAIAANPVTNMVYVANHGSNDVTVIPGTGTPQTIPLTTSITPFSGNQTSSSSPTFTFSATSTFAPTAPPVEAVYFQLDSEQGTWTQASNNGGGNFSGSATALQNGSHIVYAFATDGQDATSTITGVQSSPLIGSIASYTFSVTGSGSSFSASPSPLAFGNQTQGTTSSAKTLTVTNMGSTNLSISSVVEGGIDAVDFPIASDTCNGASLAANATCTLSIKFAPTTTAAESATLTFTDNASDSPQVVNLTGTGTAPVQTATTTALSASATTIAFGTSVKFTATVTPTSGTPTPTGTVTFKDGTTTLGTGTLSSGVATYTTTTLALGSHSVTASYGGDAFNLPSTSSAVSVGVTVIGTAASPTFTPAAGTYYGTQSVTIASTTPGAMIYYTTDGSTPPTSPTSTLYSSPVSVTASETINAVATAANYSTSPVVSAAYVISQQPPTFTLASSPSSLTILAGHSGTTNITVTPQNGFNSAVSFSCTGSGVTCAFSPASVTPTGNAPATSVLTVSDAPAVGALGRTPIPWLPGTSLAVVICLFGLRKRRSLLQLALLLAVGIAGLSALSGCGGTPKPRTAFVVVQATSGQIQQSASLTVTIDY